MSTHIEAVLRNLGNLRGVLSLSRVVRGVRRGMAAPPDVGGRDVTAGIPGSEYEHASTFRNGKGQVELSTATDGMRDNREPWLMEVIGKRMEPNRLSIRLFGGVRADVAEVTEVQLQV
jgi:hypothetical protein